MLIEKYVKVASAEEAYRLLSEDSTNKIIAGGAWLKLTDPTILTAIDLSDLHLESITVIDNHLEIGAMTRLRTLETSPLVCGLANGILSQAAGKIMGITVRNVATIGGSIMGRFGFSDLVTPLLALDAQLQFVRLGKISLAEFLTMKENVRDVLLKITLPITDAVGYFHKIARTSLDFAVVNVSVVKNKNAYRIVIGARPGIAALAEKAAAYLANQTDLTEAVLTETARIAGAEMKFSSNQRATALYREQVAKVYVQRGIKAVNQR